MGADALSRSATAMLPRGDARTRQAGRAPDGRQLRSDSADLHGLARGLCLAISLQRAIERGRRVARVGHAAVASVPSLAMRSRGIEAEARAPWQCGGAPGASSRRRQAFDASGSVGSEHWCWRSIARRSALDAPSPPRVSAQDARTQWWENFPGFGRSEGQPRTQPTRTAAAARSAQRSAPRRDAAAQPGDGRGARGRHPALSADRLQRRLADDSRHALIRPEDNDERVGLLYRRLAISGELDAPAQPDLFGIDYSDGLEAAVRRFQENHGLRVTGRVDQPTLQALNVPAQARLAQLGSTSSVSGS